VQAAHRRGALVVVHVLSEQKARAAIAAGADGLAHLFIGEDASPDFGQCAAAHHVFVIPTLMILSGLCGKPQGQSRRRATLMLNSQSWARFMIETRHDIEEMTLFLCLVRLFESKCKVQVFQSVWFCSRQSCPPESRLIWLGFGPNNHISNGELLA
jgi:hypothetical protein